MDLKFQKIKGRNKMMKKQIKQLIFIFFVSSCDIGMPVNQKEYLQNIEPVYLTLKEDLFEEELEKAGYSNINYTKPNIGLYELGRSEYKISLKGNYFINKKNNDSIQSKCDSIINKLYLDVIDDSIIYDCYYFKINLSFNNSKINHKYSILNRKYLKKDLEKLNHFKVIKVGKNEYKRIKI